MQRLFRNFAFLVSIFFSWMAFGIDGQVVIGGASPLPPSQVAEGCLASTNLVRGADTFQAADFFTYNRGRWVARGTLDATKRADLLRNIQACFASASRGSVAGSSDCGSLNERFESTRGAASASCGASGLRGNGSGSCETIASCCQSQYSETGGRGCSGLATTFERGELSCSRTDRGRGDGRERQREIRRSCEAFQDRLRNAGRQYAQCPGLAGQGLQDAITRGDTAATRLDSAGDRVQQAQEALDNAIRDRDKDREDAQKELDDMEREYAQQVQAVQEDYRADLERIGVNIQQVMQQIGEADAAVAALDQREQAAWDTYQNKVDEQVLACITAAQANAERRRAAVETAARSGSARVAFSTLYRRADVSASQVEDGAVNREVQSCTNGRAFTVRDQGFQRARTAEITAVTQARAQVQARKAALQNQINVLQTQTTNQALQAALRKLQQKAQENQARAAQLRRQLASREQAHARTITAKERALRIAQAREEEAQDSADFYQDLIALRESAGASTGTTATTTPAQAISDWSIAVNAAQSFVGMCCGCNGSAFAPSNHSNCQPALNYAATRGRISCGSTQYELQSGQATAVQ